MNSIGYFQLDNLIRGRIPMLFLNFGVDLKPWYGPLEKIHLGTWAIASTRENYYEHLQERQAPTDFGIIVLCPDGELSKIIAEELIQKGHTNTYWVDGGFAELERQKQSE